MQASIVSISCSKLIYIPLRKLDRNAGNTSERNVAQELSRPHRARFADPGVTVTVYCVNCVLNCVSCPRNPCPRRMLANGRSISKWNSRESVV